MAATPQRFLFETSFDDESLLGPPGPAPAPAPAFTDDDLQAARETAFAEGEASGQTAAKDSIEKRLLDGLDGMIEQVARLTEEQARFQRCLAEQAARLALVAARKILPEAARRDGLPEITAVVEDCLRQLPEQPRIAIRVAEEMLEPLRPHVENAARRLGHEGSIQLAAEPGLGPADCRIEWADGGAERLAERVWSEIDEAIERVYGAPPDLPADAVVAPDDPADDPIETPIDAPIKDHAAAAHPPAPDEP
ncbi:MAG: hypothetical protein HKM95_04230, partial [Inquilinus sp.]|nr:hypothetical protein [Inquilinus sp.]